MQDNTDDTVRAVRDSVSSGNSKIMLLVHSHQYLLLLRDAILADPKILSLVPRIGDGRNMFEFMRSKSQIAITSIGSRNTLNRLNGMSCDEVMICGIAESVGVHELIAASMRCLKNRSMSNISFLLDRKRGHVVQPHLHSN